MTHAAARRATVVALYTALLAACSTQPQKPASPDSAPASPPSSPVSTPLTEAPVVASSDTSPATIAEPASPWPRLRARFAMTTCDYRPQVMRWAHRYTTSPQRFAASWERAMPFLEIVVDEIERRNLPGEFAMLPYVESGYEPVIARGDRPSGMWQLDPDTAREEKLVVDADYDARLDPNASTTAALGLIERYEKEFGDWRLADMAFNSGEYRVKALLRGRDAHALSAAELGKLAFNPITHDHLDRLLALACIVEDPARFNVTLPEPAPGERLKTIVLQSGMDVRLAAHLAGIDPADMQRFNAAYRRHRMVTSVPYALTMPSDHVDRFQAAAQTIPVAFWNDWREQRAARTSGLASWAAEVGIPVAVLAAANAVAETSTIEPSTRLLLPGREPDPAPAASASPFYVVKRGDTLAGIAHSQHVPLAEIRRLNPALASKSLHPGDRVRVGTRDAD